jgi:phosphotransferase system HPr (HPr) family protein
MPKIMVTLTNKVGLHARPAGALVRVAKQFKAEIKVGHRDKEANGKSILSVLSLGAEKGSLVSVEADGDDADQALAALQELVQAKFGEPE